MEENQLKKFIEENKERIEKFKRINESVIEDMEEIKQNKAEHPELFEPEYQLKIVNDFIEKNSDTNVVELREKNSK